MKADFGRVILSEVALSEVAVEDPSVLLDKIFRQIDPLIPRHSGKVWPIEEFCTVRPGGRPAISPR